MHRAAMEGWHRLRSCWGRWDVNAIISELGNFLIHSDARTRQNRRDLADPMVTLLFALEDDSLVFIDRFGEDACVCVWSHTPDEANRCFESLAKRFKRRERRSNDTEFHILVASDKGFDTRSITFPARKHDAETLALHYGSDFPKWDKQMQAVLKRGERGLTILRGEPGTGKTSYLRHLMWKLRSTHRFYYLPISAYALIAAPAAVDFWIQQAVNSPRRGKIVIIEDAEALLMQRGADNRDSVSNLLNISDGFMAEYLRLHVVCTINCALKNLDPALTRPGRLVATREFRRLTRCEADALAQAKRLSLDEADTYSLAEVYNSSVKNSESALPQIGFHPPPEASSAGKRDSTNLQGPS